MEEVSSTLDHTYGATLEELHCRGATLHCDPPIPERPSIRGEGLSNSIAIRTIVEFSRNSGGHCVLEFLATYLSRRILLARGTKRSGAEKSITEQRKEIRWPFWPTLGTK